MGQQRGRFVCDTADRNRFWFDLERLGQQIPRVFTQALPLRSADHDVQRQSGRLDQSRTPWGRGRDLIFRIDNEDETHVS